MFISIAATMFAEMLSQVWKQRRGHHLSSNLQLMVVEKVLTEKQENISKVAFSLCQAVENLHLSNHVIIQQY